MNKSITRDAAGGRTAALRVGIGGPVGSGKTALTLALCQALRERYEIAAVTNDIYTAEDAEFLVRHAALSPERIIGVETGGCPHTAIREDASINLEAVDQLHRRFPGLDLIIAATTVTVLGSVFLHGVTSRPFARLYSRKLDSLPPDAPELAEAGEVRPRKV